MITEIQTHTYFIESIWFGPKASTQVVLPEMMFGIILVKMIFSHRPCDVIES